MPTAIPAQQPCGDAMPVEIQCATPVAYTSNSTTWASLLSYLGMLNSEGDVFEKYKTFSLNWCLIFTLSPSITKVRSSEGNYASDLFVNVSASVLSQGSVTIPTCMWCKGGGEVTNINLTGFPYTRWIDLLPWRRMVSRHATAKCPARAGRAREAACPRQTSTPTYPGALPLSST